MIMKAIALNQKDTIQLEPSLLYSKIGDEIVLLTIESGKYFKVDAVGSRIWEMIKEPMTIENLCQALTGEYDISSEECLKDITLFLERLQEDNLILIHP